MFSIISTISQWALGLIDQLGYPGVFLLSVLDRLAFNFIPAEFIFPLIGFLASQGKMNFIIGLAITVAGNFIGDVVIYLIALRGGRPLLEKFGKYLFFSNHELEHAEEWFKNYGRKLIFWGRFIPVVVTFISIPAGIVRMNFGKFSLYTILGSIPRNFLIMYAGLKAGENWDKISVYFKKFDFVIIILLALAVIYYIYRHIKKRHATHG